MNRFEASANDPIWNFIYDVAGNNANDRGYSIAETTDGGFVIAGQTANDLYLLRVDANGTELWNTTVDNGSLERAWDVIEVSSGGYATCGYVRIGSWNYFYLVRFDTDGNVDWMRNYTGRSNYEARALAETDDGGFILVGSGTMGGPLYVVKTDLNGVQTWDAEIDEGESLGGRDVLDLGGANGYVVAASMQNATSNYFYLLKIDEGGNHVWNSTHGGPEIEYCFGLTDSTDGGYALCGTTASWGGGGYDMYLLKYNSAGNLIWNKTYGGAGNEMAISIASASGGGYMLAGYAPGTGEDIWLVRTDSEGEVWWSEKTNLPGDDRPDKVIEVSDGGYALSGYVNPSVGDQDTVIYRLSEPMWNPAPTDRELELGQGLYYDINASSTDGPLSWSVNNTEDFSLDSNGILRNATSLPIGQHGLEIEVEDAHGHWIQAEVTISVYWVYSSFKFSSGQRTRIMGIVEDPDGGFVFGCRSEPVIKGSVAPWFAKYNSSGDQQWAELYPDGYALMDLIGCSTGGYAAVGYATTLVQPDDDVWLLRINQYGQHLWNKTFVASGADIGRSVVETDDGGFLVLGSTHEASSGKTDSWLIRTDSGGNHLWNKTYGYQSATDEGFDIVSCASGGYALAGYTNGSASCNNDAWLVRIDEDGAQLWNRSYHGVDVSVARGVAQLSDGGFALTGDITPVGETHRDAFVVRTNGTGFVIWNYTYGGSLNDHCAAIVQIHDGTLAAAGESYSFSGGNRDGYFLWVDLDGNFLANESAGTPEDIEYFNTIIEVGAGGLAMGGYHAPSGSLTGSAYFVQKPILKWVETPWDQTSELGDVFSIQLKASSAVGVRDWWINDQTNFTVSPSGIITNVIPLTVDDYELTVRSSDYIRNTIQATIVISVVDSTPPTWTTTPTNQEINETDAFAYQLQATDLSPLTWSVNDTVHFAVSSEGLLTNTSVLSPGEYGLNVTVSDESGNAASAAFTLTVLELTTTTTTTTSTTTSTTITSTTTSGTTTTGTGTPHSDLLLVTLIVGAIGAVVVVTILFIMRKRS